VIKIERGSDISVPTVKILVEGLRKSGKSDFILSTMEHLNEVMGYKPEEIMMCIMDWDWRGIGPLLARNRISKELKERIFYYKASPENFRECYDAYDLFEKMLLEHRNKYGFAPTWFACENMGGMWDGVREYYSMSIKNRTLETLMMEKRKEAMNAGVAKKPEFNRRDDYGVINPLHNMLRNKFLNGDFNCIITSHLKAVYGTKEESTLGDVVGYTDEGQKGNSALVDIILRKKIEKKNYVGDLRGSRYTKMLFKDLNDPTFTNLWSMIYKIMDREVKNGEIKHYWLSKKEELVGDIVSEVVEEVKKAKSKEDEGDGFW